MTISKEERAELRARAEDCIAWDLCLSSGQACSLLDALWGALVVTAILGCIFILSVGLSGCIEVTK